MTEPANDPTMADGRPDPAALDQAMAVFSADGQEDDPTGGDAAAEQLRAHQAQAGDSDGTSLS
jgi:hypothetical protein